HRCHRIRVGHPRRTPLPGRRDPAHLVRSRRDLQPRRPDRRALPRTDRRRVRRRPVRPRSPRLGHGRIPGGRSMTATLSPPVTTPPEPPTASRIRGLATTIGVPLLAVAVGLAAGGILIVLAGGDPGQAYATMLDAALGGDTQLGRLLTGMTPLVLMGLGYAIAYRTGFI